MRSTSKDRTEIATLHGLSSVNESNTSTWKKQPTLINTPKAGAMKQDIRFENPWSTGLTKNVGEARRSAKGGTGAQAGPSKPRKMDRMNPNRVAVSNRARHNTLVPTLQGDKPKEPKRPRLGPSTPHTIDLTGDVPGGHTPRPSRSLHTQDKKPPELKVAKDGEYTKQLGHKMAIDGGDSDSDPIEVGSSPPPPSKKEESSRVQPPGKVKNMVKVFEAKADPLSQLSFKPAGPPPKDLPRQSSRSHKPQSVESGGQPASSKGVQHTGKKRKRSNEGPFKLPVKKCIAKKAERFSIRDESLYLTFEKNSLKVVREGGKPILDVDIREYDERMLPGRGGEVQEAVPLRLCRPNDNGKPPAYEEVALLLDCKHSDWDLEIYQELCVWYQPHARPPASAAQDLWRKVEEEAEESLRRHPEPNSLVTANLGKHEGQPGQTKPVFGKDTNKAPGPTGSRPVATPITVPQRNSHRPLLGNVNPSKMKGTSTLGQGPAQASTSKAVPNTATSPPTSKRELVAPLRRSGRQTQSTASRNPADDEVILVFPPDVPGKVTITNADAARLQPGEFLNDTLIEFGLKLWLKKLEGEDPELAKQVHVFSSFFYKKLNKKNHEEGFKSVRKWTSKFDIFDKKYIVVPINENMHWYLAVIYEPEHVLRPPPVEATSLPSALESVLEDNTVEDESVVIVSASKSGSETAPSPATSDGEGHEPSIQEIEAMDIDPPKTPPAQTTSGGRPSSPMNLSPEVPIYSSTRKERPGDASAASSTADEADVLNLVGMADDQSTMADEALTLEIPPEQFYGSTSTRSGKQYEKPLKPARTRSSGPKVKETYRPDHTYVLTLDSLGSKHLYAAKQLSRYLVAEAKDKKGIDSTAIIQTKSVNVPTQPNFCDCGLYLLHLAETFISDAQNLIRKDFETTARTPNAERQELWRDSKVPTMRERLLSRIRTLSSQWKEAQVKKPTTEDKEDTTTKAAEDVPDSDTDSDIIEIGPITKAKRTPKKQPAARLR